MLLLPSRSSSLLAPLEMPILLHRRKNSEMLPSPEGKVTQHIGHLDCIIHVVLGRRGTEERCATLLLYSIFFFIIIEE